MVKFLEKRQSIKKVESVYKLSFLLVDDVVSGSDVFELVICLIGVVEGWKGAARLAVGEDRDL